MTIEKGRNSLPEPNTPEFKKWIRGNIDALENRAKMVREKLEKAGLLKWEDSGINPNASHKVWQYRKRDARITSSAIFDDQEKSIKLSVTDGVTYGHQTYSLIIERPNGKQRQFLYVEYRTADAFQGGGFGMFGGGYVPEELTRANADDDGQFSFRYGRSAPYQDDPEYHSEPKYIDEAFRDANEIVKEIDSSIPVEPPL